MITHAPGHMFITDLTFQGTSLLEGPEGPSVPS